MSHSHALLSFFFILLSLACEHPIIVICLLCSFCAACKCDPGGSDNKNCFKYLGNCRCVSGVEGKKCNRYYFFCSYVCFFFYVFFFLFAFLTPEARSKLKCIKPKWEGIFEALAGPIRTRRPFLESPETFRVLFE